MTKQKRWVEAGLISAEQGDAIAQFERARVRSAFVRALFGLAILSIGNGILVLVVAHWDSLSNLVKLGGHALLNLGAVALVWRGLTKGHPWFREGGLGLILALNLSFLLLLAHVLGREGSIAMLLLFWMLVSSPAILRWGRSPWLASGWTIAFLVTVAAVLFDRADVLLELSVFLLFFTAALGVPLLLLGLGTSPRLNIWSPVWSSIWRLASWWLFLGGASAATGLWYVGMGDLLREMTADGGTTMQLWLAIVGVTVLAHGVALIVTGTSERRPHARADRAMALLSLGVMAAPGLLFAGDAGFVGALLFLAFWMAIGWVGVSEGSNLLMGLAVWLVAGRVLILTFEYLGGWLATGVGLVGVGVLILLMVRVASALQDRLRKVSLARSDTASQVERPSVTEL